MEIDNTLILDLWEVARRYCPASKRDEFAYRLLHIFEDYGADSKLFDQLTGEDFNLDNAIKEWFKEISEDENFDEKEDYYLEDEDI